LGNVVQLKIEPCMARGRSLWSARGKKKTRRELAVVSAVRM
jgi:hypothetical protein